MKYILLALLLFTTILKAQNTVSVLGKVLDENDRPISGAKISITDLSIEVISDENGNFIFESIVPKTYNFIATASGFEQDTAFNIIIKSAEQRYDFQSQSNLKSIRRDKNRFKSIQTQKRITAFHTKFITCRNCNLSRWK